MRCRNAKQMLAHTQDASADADAQELRSHLLQCSDCTDPEPDQQDIERMLKVSRPLVERSFSSTNHVSTNSIMQAVQQQVQITQQLVVLQEQQRTRVARMRNGGAAVAAIAFFTLGSIPLLLLAITLVQTDLMVHLLLLLGNVVDVLYILGQYVQMALTMVTHNSLLLAGVSFAVVVMMAMWLRLMRPPREA